MPIRVLHIVTYMGRGGLETMLMNYFRKIDRNKVVFDFLVHRSFKADYDNEIEELGGKIYHMSRLVPWSKSYRNELKNFFFLHPEYKIVHVHQDCLSSVALQCAEECGIPVRIAHSHNASQDKNLKYPIKLFYKKFIPKYATDLFACSKSAGDWMFNGYEYNILQNAIPSQDFSFSLDRRTKIRSEMNLKDSFTIGLTARFSKQKNHLFLLEIFKEICNIEPNSILILAGDGELRTDIEKKIKQLNLTTNVVIAGVRNDISDLLQAMDVFVMPSLYEGLSLAAIEAQAAGLSCFISNAVSSECIVTENVEQISLSSSPVYWAKRILSKKGAARKDTCNQIKSSGFDITENAEKLQNFYIRKAKQ